MSRNQVDTIVRKTMLFSRLFTKSFGRPENLKSIKYILENIFAKRLTIELVERSNPKMIITKEYQKSDYRYIDGHFISPLYSHTPSLFPSENTTVCHWKGLFTTKNMIGTVILLAPTGDHSYFLRQLQFANYLLERGVNAILVENPFYGRRKPQTQFRSSLENVADLFVMGASLITECVYIFKWLNDSEKYPSKMAISGVSMGGFNASLTATNVNFPIATIPCLTWSSAAPIFTMGALSHAINWKNLEAELESPKFREELQQIPDCDWLDRLHSSQELGSRNFSRAQKFMWILMDQYTNLNRFSQPLRPDLAKFIISEHDAYIVRTGVPEMSDIWPGCEVEIIPNAGHIQGFLQNVDRFRNGIIEMMAKIG